MSGAPMMADKDAAIFRKLDAVIETGRKQDARRVLSEMAALLLNMAWKKDDLIQTYMPRFAGAFDLRLEYNEVVALVLEAEKRAEEIFRFAEPRVLDLRALADTEPPPPRFLVDDWLPEGEVTLFAGHGGSGKSALALRLALCVALERPFFGLPVQGRRVLFLSLEDNADVLHWRLARLAAAMDFRLDAVADRLFLFDAARVNGELMVDTRDGLVHTRMMVWLREALLDTQARLLVIDGASDAFGGNENVRQQVKTFLRDIRRLIPAGGAALLLAHVDKATARGGGDTSQGYSGSTAWSNSVRSRWYLRPAEGGAGLLLELQKANHAAAGAQIAVTWDAERHLFDGQGVAPADSAERASAEERERAQLLALFRAAEAANDPVPASAGGPRTAWHVLSARDGFPAAMRGNKSRFRALVEQLRAAGDLYVDSIRKPNRHTGEVFRVREGF